MIGLGMCMLKSMICYARRYRSHGVFSGNEAKQRDSRIENRDGPVVYSAVYWVRSSLTFRFTLKHQAQQSSHLTWREVRPAFRKYEGSCGDNMPPIGIESN